MITYIGNTDSTTRTMLEGILAVEEEHAEDLSTLLATLDPKVDKTERRLHAVPNQTFHT
jgi:bacterioferritin (cytochrome b1)